MLHSISVTSNVSRGRNRKFNEPLKPQIFWLLNSTCLWLSVVTSTPVECELIGICLIIFRWPKATQLRSYLRCFSTFPLLIFHLSKSDLSCRSILSLFRFSFVSSSGEVGIVLCGLRSSKWNVWFQIWREKVVVGKVADNVVEVQKIQLGSLIIFLETV